MKASIFANPVEFVETTKDDATHASEDGKFYKLRRLYLLDSDARHAPMAVSSSNGPIPRWILDAIYMPGQSTHGWRAQVYDRDEYVIIDGDRRVIASDIPSEELVNFFSQAPEMVRTLVDIINRLSAAVRATGEGTENGNV